MLTDTRVSPYAKVSPLPGKGGWSEGLWKEEEQVVFEKTVPQLQRMFEDKNISHVLENFRIAAGEAEGSFDGTVFGDGDFYKWMEAAMYRAAATQDKALFDKLDRYIDLFSRAQQADGYLSTKQIIGEREANGTKRMGDINDFEVYNFGHLFTSAALYYRLTGKKNFLQIASRTADYLDWMYTEAETKGEVRTAVCPSHYMGLIELYRATREKKYLDLTKKAVRLRDSVENGLDDNQDRLPLKQHRKIIGHAVRANYLYAGLADLYLEEGDAEYKEVLDSVWEDLLQHKIYITGGCGALYNGASPYGNFFDHQLVHQAYGYAYQLPNITAYNETCANVGLVMWAYRMFQADPKAEYFDIIERVMLNTNLASLSLDGMKFFYENMLERTDHLEYELVWPLCRTDYITSYCCPPNLARNLAQSYEYSYLAGDDTVYTGLYGNNHQEVTLANGASFTLTQKTGYPYSGTIHFEMSDVKHNPEQGTVKLALRIPVWSRESKIVIRRGEEEKQIRLNEEKAGNYFTTDLGDLQDEHVSVELTLDMEVRLTAANGYVEEDQGKACVEMGPLVYCMEAADLKDKADNTSLQDLNLMVSAEWEKTEVEICGRKVGALTGTMVSRPSHDTDRNSLYHRIAKGRTEQISVRMVPYYAWDNRGNGEMKIWFPVQYI